MAVFHVVQHEAVGVGGDGFTGAPDCSARDLQRRRVACGNVERGAAQDGRGGHGGLRQSGGGQAATHAVMFGALAHCKDVAVGGTHPIGHDNPAIDWQAGFSGQLARRANADGHHDQVGLDHPAVRQFDPVRLVTANDPQRRGGQDRVDPLRRQPLPQPCGTTRVELAFHQPVHGMHNGHGHAPARQARGRFQPQQPAADDDGVPARRSRVHHGLYVRQGTVQHNAGQIGPGQAQPDGVRPGRQHEAVVLDRLAIRKPNQLGWAIHRRHLHPVPVSDGVMGRRDQRYVVHITGE